MGKISEVLRHHFVLNMSVRQSGKSAGVSKSVANFTNQEKDIFFLVVFQKIKH